ncbi:MAG: GTP-binding protein [Candidatus Thorarchaeota archaeon]|nr:GTP-binding protein [Candidatus Thorarchaeota archaeon]
MIHSTVLLRSTSGRTIASSQYWTIQVPKKDITEFLKVREQLLKVSTDRGDVSLTVAGNKYFGREINSDLFLIFIADIEENDRSVNEKITNAANTIREVLKLENITYIKKQYDKLISSFVHSKLKVALVGEGGVGKTTTLHLLMGKRPPTQYIPTIALAMEVIENIHFANYSLVLWDFAGQERFRKLWKLYFQGADIVFLLTDSTLRNILISKEMFQMIRRDAPHVPIIVIANKQDCPNALDPSIIERVIGAETYPLVAIDMTYRDDILKLLLNTAAKHVNIPIPDLPPEELLRFSEDEESSKVAGE